MVRKSTPNRGANMRVVGNATPDIPVTRRGTNPKYDSSYRAALKAAADPFDPRFKPFKTPPMTTGAYKPYVPPQMNRTGVEKVGRGGGIRGLGRKIFGER